jgi:hypothetical protein
MVDTKIIKLFRKPSFQVLAGLSARGKKIIQRGNFFPH